MKSIQSHSDKSLRGAGNKSRCRIVKMRHHKLSNSWRTVIGMYKEVDAFHKAIDQIMEKCGCRPPTPHNIPSLRYHQIKNLKENELARGEVGD